MQPDPIEKELYVDRLFAIAIVGELVHELSSPDIDQASKSGCIASVRSLLRELATMLDEDANYFGITADHLNPAIDEEFSKIGKHSHWLVRDCLGELTAQDRLPKLFQGQHR